MMKVLSAVAAIALAGLLAGPLAAEDPAETAAQLTAEQSAGIMKNFVASKFGIKEYCKQTNPAQVKVIEESWSTYLASESPEMKAYAATDALKADGAERLQDNIKEAGKSDMARDSLAKYCALVLEHHKF